MTRKVQGTLLGFIGGFTLIFALVAGSGTAGAAVSAAGNIKSVQSDMVAAVEVQQPAVLYVSAAQARSGSWYSCPLIAVTCTLYVSYSQTVKLHDALKGAGAAAGATTAGKVLCSLAPPLKPFSAVCGVLFAARMKQIQDQLAYAVRSGRCFEVKTTKPTPVTFPPGNPPVTVISIGTWDTGDKGTDGRICK